MSKEKDVKPIENVVEEIKEQDLDEKAGAGISTAIQLTLAGKCGGFPTISYECTSNNVSCGK
jgi:hypothetical protein